MSGLVIEALDGADTGADEGELGGGVAGAPARRRRRRRRAEMVAVIEQRGLQVVGFALHGGDRRRRIKAGAGAPTAGGDRGEGGVGRMGVEEDDDWGPRH